MSSYTTTHPKFPNREIEIECPDMRILHYHGDAHIQGFELEYGPVYAYIYYHEDKRPGVACNRMIEVTDHPELCNYERLEEACIDNATSY
jgi:hypothetical protein